MCERGCPRKKDPGRKREDLWRPVKTRKIAPKPVCAERPEIRDKKLKKCLFCHKCQVLCRIFEHVNEHVVRV